MIGGRNGRRESAQTDPRSGALGEVLTGFGVIAEVSFSLGVESGERVIGRLCTTALFCNIYRLNIYSCLFIHLLIYVIFQVAILMLSSVKMR